MADLITYPIEDGYESKLSQPYDGISSTIYVDSIPTATLPSGQKVLVTINPGTTYAQTVEVSGRTTGQLTVSSTTVEKANGVNYTTRTHGAKSPIIISDNFAYWEAIATAVNSKSDKASPVFTGSVGLPTYANATARDTAIPSPTQAMMVKTNNVVQHYNSATAQWEDLDVGTPVPNASTAVAGKAEKANPTEVTNGTSTGGTGAELFVGPAELKTVTDAITASNVFGGDGSDGAIDGTANVTITGSNNTYIVKNYSSITAGTAPRTFTITPIGCVLHIKVKGNADLSNWTFSFNGKGGQGGAGSTGGASGTAGSSFIQILQKATTGGAASSGGAGNGADGSGSGAGVRGNVFGLDTIKGRRYIEIGGGSGGGGGQGISTTTGGSGGNGGGCIIIEVFGNVTLNSSTTIINLSGTNGGNATAPGAGAGNGGGGGGGGSIYFMYGGSLTGTCTPNVSAGTGGNGVNGGVSGFAGGVGLSLIEKNTVF